MITQDEGHGTYDVVFCHFAQLIDTFPTPVLQNLLNIPSRNRSEFPSLFRSDIFLPRNDVFNLRNS